MDSPEHAAANEQAMSAEQLAARTIPDEPASARTMQIGEIAERTGMSFRTLRHYDEVGLLTPSARSQGGFRLYTDADLAKLLVIRRMKPLGYSIEEMLAVRVLTETIREQGANADPQLQVQLREAIEDANERRARLRRHLDMVDEFIGILEGHVTS